MIKPITGIIATLSLLGCVSSLPTTTQIASPREIQFSEIESLQLGTTTTEQLTEKFGPPQAIHPYSDKHDRGEIWEYGSANFFIDPVHKLVLTVAMSLKETDTLHSQEVAIRHFKGKTFSSKDVGWIARHEYSHEAILTSNDRTVSLTVDKTRKTVSSIGLIAPIRPAIAVKN